MLCAQYNTHPGVFEAFPHPFGRAARRDASVAPERLARFGVGWGRRQWRRRRRRSRRRLRRDRRPGLDRGGVRPLGAARLDDVPYLEESALSHVGSVIRTWQCVGDSVRLLVGGVEGHGVSRPESSFPIFLQQRPGRRCARRSPPARRRLMTLSARPDQGDCF